MLCQKFSWEKKKKDEEALVCGNNSGNEDSEQIRDIKEV